MSRRASNGADILCATLSELNVDRVFGLPGTQNIALFEALRRSPIRPVLATHELAASFMANGYYRASGKPGVLVTIPGPGFTYSLTGLAEARHDSAALLHIVGQPARAPGTRFQLQAIDQRSVAQALVKRVYCVDRASDMARTLRTAHHHATSGEPGPVIVQIASDAWLESAELPARLSCTKRERQLDRQLPDLREISDLLQAAKRPILFVGQGGLGCAPELRCLAERFKMPVLTTPSARGVVPEDHSLALGLDYVRGEVLRLNELLHKSDLILALGCKFSHNGNGGSHLRLPPDRLIKVNTDAEALHAEYPAGWAIETSVEAAVERLLQVPEPDASPTTGWQPAELAEWRGRLRVTNGRAPREPRFPGLNPPSAATFFQMLRRAMPPESILVTDSGLHQVLVRRHYDVLSPRGLIMPSDFQSMGFGVPAALGACIAAPDRPVVAVVGDGGFLMTGLELLTAVREHLPLTVIVLNDGYLNLIRLQQNDQYGHSSAVTLRNPNFEAFAQSVGADYLHVEGDSEPMLSAAVRSSGVTLVEVTLGDSAAIRVRRGQSMARETVRAAIGPRGVAWFKRLLGRG